MIHATRRTVSPVANIVFAWNLFCFEKCGRTRTYERTPCAKTTITTGRDWGAASWIKRCNDRLVSKNRPRPSVSCVPNCICLRNIVFFLIQDTILSKAQEIKNIKTISEKMAKVPIFACIENDKRKIRHSDQNFYENCLSSYVPICALFLESVPNQLFFLCVFFRVYCCIEKLIILAWHFLCVQTMVRKDEIQDTCHQWSTWPDPQSRQ